MSNYYYLKLPITNQVIQIPIEIQWDFLDRSDSIEIYQDEIIKQVIGSPEDFEINQFAHDVVSPLNSKTDVNYEFYFYNTGSPINISATTATDIVDWVNSYVTEGFTTKEIYYFSNPFTKSFFKLDFYDNPDPKNQINYFTIIIPTQQGFTMTASTSPSLPNVLIKKPKFKLDYVGDKEGFFIYWLRSKTYLNIDTFYMSAKFFDAKIGVFVKMMNESQALLPSGVGKFNFSGATYFYNKVVLDYDKKTYQIFNSSNQRIGFENNPIKWYEYVNQ